MELPINPADYPAEIARLRLKVLDTEQHIRAVNASIADCTLAIEVAVATDKGLTNETLRKTRKQELIANDADLMEASQVLQSLKDEMARTEIQIELLRNEQINLRIAKEHQIALMTSTK